MNQQPGQGTPQLDAQRAPYRAPSIQTLALPELWRRLGPAVALTSSPDLFESLVPSDPADGLFDD